MNNETYRTALWATNDQSMYESVKERIRHCVDVDDAMQEIATHLEAHMYAIPDGEHGAFVPPHFREAWDVFFSSVDWSEIAEHYRDEVEVYFAEEGGEG